MFDVRMRLPDEYREISPKEMMAFYGKYDEILNISEKQSTTLNDLLDEMEKSGVEKGIIHAEYEFGERARELNNHVIKIVESYPNKLFGFGTIDLTQLKPSEMIDEVNHIYDGGLHGINLQPVFFNVDPLDRRLYPVYAEAEKLGLIVSFHTGIHYSLKSSFTNNNPLFIDQVAVDFPKLKIIACHAGFPWTAEMVAVTRRHSNVYVEFGGIDPKYIGFPGTGWDPIFTILNNLLSDQILFGTDWPVMSQAKAIKSWKHLNLKDEVYAKLFKSNIEKLLGI